MSGRKTSEKSKEIISLIEQGMRLCDIAGKGYPKETVRYYYRKLKMPAVHKRYIKTITKYNKIRAKLDKTQ